MDDLSKSLPKKIEEALNEPPICNLQKTVAIRNIEAFLAIELTKLQSLINIDERLNLQPHQIGFIASTLIETYAFESLADFKICFQKGALGLYGKIFRLDAAIINDWVKCYLDEKYLVKEQILIKERKSNAEQYDGWTDERLKEWIEAIGYKEQKPENVNEYERLKVNTPSRCPRKNFIHMLYKNELVDLAAIHEKKNPDDMVMNFKIENQTIVAKDQEEAQEIFTEVYL